MPEMQAWIEDEKDAWLPTAYCRGGAPLGGGPPGGGPPPGGAPGGPPLPGPDFTKVEAIDPANMFGMLGNASVRT